MITKEPTRMKALLDYFLFLGVGMLLGLAMIALREARAVYDNVVEIQSSFDLQIYQGETQALLAKAEIAGFNGDYEKVMFLLAPNLAKFSVPGEAAEAYSLLGKAEFNSGHPQLAAGYFEQVLVYEPTSANLYFLAVAYDAGGNLNSALEKYSLFIVNPDSSATPEMVDNARQRIDQILALGLRLPSTGNP
jgi:tetratricopeptide (TPR) repeat protein